MGSGVHPHPPGLLGSASKIPELTIQRPSFFKAGWAASYHQLAPGAAAATGSADLLTTALNGSFQPQML